MHEWTCVFALAASTAFKMYLPIASWLPSEINNHLFHGESFNLNEQCRVHHVCLVVTLLILRVIRMFFLNNLLNYFSNMTF